MTMPLRRIAATILSLLGVALIIASGGSTDGAPTWSKSFGGEFFDSVASTIPTADGGYLFVGNRDGLTYGELGIANENFGALWVVKLDALGDIAWERKLGDATVAAESGEITRNFTRIVAAADGGAWLIGTENTPSVALTDLVVARLDSAGQVLWTRAYDSDWDVPNSHFYPDGETRETLGAAVETPQGALLIAARADAFVRDTSVDEDGNDVGVELGSTYLLKLAADGTVLVSRHTNIQVQRFSGTPVAVRVLADGGAAVLVSESRHTMLLVTDAGGALRSKTAMAASDTFVASGTSQPDIADVVPMRRTAIEGPAGDDGYVIVGQRSPRIDDSFIARYLASPRDADDPTEGEDRREVNPLENDWRIEIPEISTVWVVAANCGPAPSVNQRCGVIVAGQGRDTAGAMLLAGIDAEGSVSESLRAVPGIGRVCAIQQEPGLTGDGRLAFRLLASTLAGGSATFVIDDSLTVVPFSFVETSGRSCGSNDSATFATDGEWAALSNSNAVVDVSRATSSGAERWRQSFPTTGTRSQRALTARQTDDDGDGALDDGYIIAGEIRSSTDQDERAALVIKLGPLGEIDWQRVLSGLSFTDFGSPLTANVLAVQNSGYGLVAHDATGAARALKLDRAGTIIWQQSLWGMREYEAPSIASLSDGGWIVGSGQFARAEPAALVRLGPSGDTRWTRTLGNLETIDSIVETADGKLVVAGRRVLDVVVAKIDASGVPLWSHRLSAVDAGGLGSSDVHVGIAPDNGVIVATTIRGSRTGAAAPEVEPEGFQQDLLVQKYDGEGLLMWARRYGGRYDDVLTSLTSTSDGGAILGASSSSLGHRNDRTEAWLLRLGPDGGISPTCAAELVPGEFAGILISAGGVTSVVTDRQELGAVDGVPLPNPVDTSLIALPSSSASTVARQCSGSVAPARNLPRSPLVHLRVIQGGAITGVVSSVPAGILCGVAGGGTCEADFDQDLLVTLNVDSGSRPTFESWTGCDSVIGTQCRVNMTADRTVNSTFATEPRPPTVGLVLNSIAGRGRVTGTGGMNCHLVGSAGDTCSVSLQRGSTAQLAATPDAGRTFLGWGGGCASFGSTRVIDFVMNEGQTCAAQFTGPPPGAPQISVEVQPTTAGNVTSAPAGIDCGASNSLCTEGFVSGTDVTLTADATLPGWEFESFQCQGQSREYARATTIAGLASNTQCRADFSNGIERLFVRIVRDANAANALGRVYVEGGGLDCRRDCDRPFPRDQLLIVRAEPLSQYVLSGWSGCRRVLPDNTNPGALSYCEVLMDQRHEVIAFFSELGAGPNPLRSLVVNFANGSAPGLVTSTPGAIDCTPSDGICVATYNVGTAVRLDVTPGAGATLTSDAGCDTLTPASGATPAQCRLTMSADRVVTFGFTRANTAPVAAYISEPVNPLEGQLVTFDASPSSDDIGIASYAWDFEDNGTVDATSSVASHTYAMAGTYTVRLTVTDAAGLSDDEVRTIVVSPSVPAVPVITQQPQSVTVAVGDTATFSVLASGVPPLSYRWLRDGVNAQIGNLASYTTPPVAAADDGDVIQVIVTNGGGSTTSATAVLTVGRGWRLIGGTIASPAFRPSLALDAANTRYVSYAAPRGSAHGLYVKRFNGAGWELLGGGAVNPIDDGSTQEQMLVLGADGLPIVAWVEATRVRVARWTGTQWNFIGDDISVDNTDIASLSNMQIARAGADVVVAWSETVGFPIPERHIAVKRYDAAAGTWSGGYVPDVTDAIYIRMALDASGLPTIAYVPQSLAGVAGAIRVVRQSATGWAPLGGDVGPVPVANSSGYVGNYGFDIHFNAANVPVVFGSVDGIHLFAFRNSTGAWTPLTGTDGVFVSLDPVNESTLLMAFTRSGPQIAVGYTRTQRQSNGGLRFFTEFLNFDGTAWSPIGEPLSFVSYSISPQLDSSGNPIFAADYRSAGGFNEVLVQQFLP